MDNQNLEKIFIEHCEKIGKEFKAIKEMSYCKKHEWVYSFSLSAIDVEYVYRKKATSLIPPSTLYCRIYLDKHNQFHFPLPELSLYMKEAEFRAVYFPYIENEVRMEKCIQTLTEIVQTHLEELVSWAQNGQAERILYDQIRAIKKLFRLKELNVESVLESDSYEHQFFCHMLKCREEMMIYRCTLYPPYYHFLQGEWQKAEEGYQKSKQKGEILEFEEQLVCFMESGDHPVFVPMSPACFSMKDAFQYITAGRYGIILLQSIAIMFLICSVAYCGIMGLIQLFFKTGTVAFFGEPWYMGCLIGALPALFGGIALRKQIFRMIRKKEAKKFLAFDEIINSKKLNKAAHILFGIIAAGMLLLACYVPTSSLRFFNDYGDMPSSEDFLKREQFGYTDIDRVYYVAARYNEWDERIERASYILVMKDGRRFDLDGYVSVEETEGQILPLLVNWKIKVYEVDSEKDIPGAEP